MTVILAMFLFPNWKKAKEIAVAASIKSIVKTISDKVFFFICIKVRQQSVTVRIMDNKRVVTKWSG